MKLLVRNELTVHEFLKAIEKRDAITISHSFFLYNELNLESDSLYFCALIKQGKLAYALFAGFFLKNLKNVEEEYIRYSKDIFQEETTKYLNLNEYLIYPLFKYSGKKGILENFLLFLEKENYIMEVVDDDVIYELKPTSLYDFHSETYILIFLKNLGKIQEYGFEEFKIVTYLGDPALLVRRSIFFTNLSIFSYMRLKYVWTDSKKDSRSDD